MNEFRLYYECYEQAFHFLIPALKSVYPDAKITLVKISTLSKTSVVSKNIVDAIYIKNADAIFTKLIDEEEHGLLWLEFSTAVETKDHDLQRFDSIVAASLSKIPFVKLWAKKLSTSSHGGELNYDRSIPWKISKQILGNIAIEVEWPLSDDNFSAIRHFDYKSCPADYSSIAHILDLSIKGLDQFQNPSYFFNNDLNTQPWLSSILKLYSSPITYPNLSNSKRLHIKNNDWHLKFNRWGHAMDPERGMAWYYRYYFKKDLIGLLQEKNLTTINQAIENFKNATGINLKSYSSVGPHNIDREIANSKVNRSGLAIILNCKAFHIFNNDNTLLISFEWSKVNLQNIINNSIQIKKATVLKPYNNITEDEVTYSVACSLYPLNNFTIESVSYPGAQGDKALMEGVGRKAKRTYIDVVAIKKENDEIILSLTESKGNKLKKQLLSDISKVLSWKFDNQRKEILLKTYNLKNKLTILTSIAYPSSVLINLDLQQLDFVVTVHEDNWAIWSKAGQIPKGFTILEGKVSFLPRFSY